MNKRTNYMKNIRRNVATKGAHNTHHRILAFLGLLALTLGVTGGKAHALPTLYPTGYDSLGNLIAIGSGGIDGHYTYLTTNTPWSCY
jgi:hypothetical protein